MDGQGWADASLAARADTPRVGIISNISSMSMSHVSGRPATGVCGALPSCVLGAVDDHGSTAYAGYSGGEYVDFLCVRREQEDLLRWQPQLPVLLGGLLNVRRRRDSIDHRDDAHTRTLTNRYVGGRGHVQ